MKPSEFFTVGRKYRRTLPNGSVTEVTCVAKTVDQSKFDDPPTTTTFHFEHLVPAHTRGKKYIRERVETAVLIVPPGPYAHFNEWTIQGDKLTCVLRAPATKDRPENSVVTLTYEVMQ